MRTPTVVSDLGNVLQPGIIGSVKDMSAPNGNGRWVYMVGNGYDSVSHAGDAVRVRRLQRLADQGDPNGRR